MITGFERALLALLLVVLMLGMGCTLEPRAFREVARKPKGLLIGIASQFGWMPLVAFGLAKGFGLPPELAIGLVLIGSTPGGTTSNLFAYYAKADIALSISMTVTSTVVAVAAMPAVLWVYATPFTSAELSIPFGSVVGTLLVMLLPVALGMVIRSRSERWARRLERLGSHSGVAVLVLIVGSTVVNNVDALMAVSGAMLAAALLLGLAGFALGLGGARLAGLAVPQRRAVAFETSIQNSPLAFGIILASFEAPASERMLQMPMLYALLVLVSASVITATLRKLDSRSGAA